MGLFHERMRPCRVCPHFFALHSSHGANHDPVNARQIDLAGIIKQGLKSNVIVLCPNIGLQGVDAPQL